MHGSRLIRLVDEDGTQIVEYAAPTQPAVGETVQYKGKFFTPLGVCHSLKTGRDGSGEYARFDVVIIKVKELLPY